jgi:hypothetical protein
MEKKPLKIIAILLCALLVIQQTGFAQVASVELNIAGNFASLHNTLNPDKFRPLHLRYLSYDQRESSFKLFLDKGDQLDGLTGLNESNQLNAQTQQLLNYFFIGVTLPNDSFWVNLRPDSPDNIIDPLLAQTDIGRILLEADVQLKKDTASYTSPQTSEGRKYWDKLYRKAGELFGNENITIPTLTRPWIVPDEIIIREAESNAYIYKATLKVMLEHDFLKGSATYNFADPRLKTLNEYSSQLVRELIIPKLNREINNSKRYAPLRQVYYSLILAQWFKLKFLGKGGLYSGSIDKKNLTGLYSTVPYSKDTYFKQYQQSFKNGEYSLKEPVQTPFGQSIRSYFSGGTDLGRPVMRAIQDGLVNANENIPSLPFMLSPPVFSAEVKPVGSSPVVGRLRFSITVGLLALALAAQPITPEPILQLNATELAGGTNQQQEQGARFMEQGKISLTIKGNGLYNGQIKVGDLVGEGIWSITGLEGYQVLLVNGSSVSDNGGTIGTQFGTTIQIPGRVLITVGKDGKVYDASGVLIGTMGADGKIAVTNEKYGASSERYMELENGTQVPVTVGKDGKVYDANGVLIGTMGADGKTPNITNEKYRERYIPINGKNVPITVGKDGKVYNKSNGELIGTMGADGETTNITNEKYGGATSEGSLTINGKEIPVTVGKDGKVYNKSNGELIGTMGADGKTPNITNEKYRERYIPINGKNVPVDKVGKVYYRKGTKEVIGIEDPKDPNNVIITNKNIGNSSPVNSNLVVLPLLLIAFSESRKLITESNVLEGTTPKLSLTEGVGSSPLSKKGGIAFQSLPIVIEPITAGNFLQQFSKLGVPLTVNPNLDLTKEWLDMQRMLKADIIPSTERIKDYLLNCYLRRETGQEMNKIIACIADILKIEEQRCVPTDPLLKGLLTLADSKK